jgi:stage II sporulation protein D
MLKTGCLLLSLILWSHLSFGAVPSIKVLIGKALDQVVVQGMDLKKKFHIKNQIKQYRGKRAISFKCDTKSPRQAFLPKTPLLVASLSSPTGLISWGENKYLGELHLVANPAKESCDLINQISLESYISTLLAKEMNGSWPLEALKAQAVAARTYALERIKKNPDSKIDQESLYHLESSEKDQVSGTFNDITGLTLEATNDTKGEVLLSPSGRIAPTFFHSKCGGKTLRPDQVWGGVEEGYRSVECTFCQKTGMKDWDYRVKNQKILTMIDKVLQKYYSDQLKTSEIRFMPDSLKNSDIRLYDGDRLHVVKKSYLRNFAGRELIPSNNFILNQLDDNVVVKGHGYGHGVGLCQLGALELAKRGYSYKQILSYYFPKHRMKKVY